MHGALTQGDISSWFIAGAYTTRVPARHRYDLGLSYSTQRYDGGNPAALREVTDGSRNVGAVYGFDTFTLTPAVAVTYGARFSRYDYLADERALQPARRADAVAVRSFPVERAGLEPRPGAGRGRVPAADRTPGCGCRRSGRSRRSSRDSRFGPSAPSISRSKAERDFGASTVSLRAFRQHVDDQLVTVFGPGVDVGRRRGRRSSDTISSATSGDVDATGWGAAFRTTFVSRVHGSVEYSMTRARLDRHGETARTAGAGPFGRRGRGSIDCRACPRRSRPTCPKPPRGSSSSVV